MAGQHIDRTLGTERTFMRLLIVFGGFALLLASIGLHGLTSCSVARRPSKIGVRMALGAHAFAATRLVRATLYGVEPGDPASYAAAAAVMTIVAGFAGFVPARHAAGLDPLIALRRE